MAGPHLKMLFVVQVGPSKIKGPKSQDQRTAELWCCQCQEEGLTSSQKSQGVSCAGAFPGRKLGLEQNTHCRGCCGSEGSLWELPLGWDQCSHCIPMELTELGNSSNPTGVVCSCIQLLFRNPVWPGAASCSSQHCSVQPLSWVA